VTNPVQIVTAGLNLAGGILQLVWALLRSLVPGGMAFGMSASGEMTRILAEGGFEFVPARMEGSILEATREAKRQLKVLLVVLHSPGNADSERFLRETVTSADFCTFVDNNLLVWAEADTDHRGARACASLRVRAMPHLAVVTLVDGQMQIVWQHGGFIGTQPLVEQLFGVMDAFQAGIVAEQNERDQRDLDRQLRQQQEIEFQASLEADREKEAKRQAEKDAAAAAAQAAKDAEQAAVEKAAARDGELARKRSELIDTPTADYDGPVAKLRFKFPGGQQIDRSFAINETTVQQVYDFVDIQDFGVSEDFSLYRSPRKLITNDNDNASQTLADAGFTACNERIMVQDNST